MEFLWTGSKKKFHPEYNELILCRDVYHCLPSELAKEDYKTIQLHLAFMEAEAEVRAQQEKNGSANKGKRKKGA